MSLYDNFMKTTAEGVTMTLEDCARCEKIAERIRGWSGTAHYAFFKALLTQPIKSLLVLGVYHGRDIAYILDILREYHPGREISIVGVDRFTADPCADWAKTNTVRTWEEEAKSPPPNWGIACANTQDKRVRIIKSDDFTFLDETQIKFDACYLDTAHDYNTVVRQLRQVPGVCMEDAIICGDDFSDEYTWGVKSAVTQKFSGHTVFAEWIWVSSLNLLKR